MDWYTGLYVSDDLKEKKDKIIDKIEHGAGTPGIYLITLASNEKNLLDILSADQLLWPVMHRLCPVIVGMTRSYDEAAELAASVILEAYKETDSFRVEPYLRSRLKEGEDFTIHYPVRKRKPLWRFPGAWTQKRKLL